MNPFISEWINFAFKLYLCISFQIWPHFGVSIFTFKYFWVSKNHQNQIYNFQMVAKGCQYTIPLGFNWYPFEGPGI